MTLLASLPRIGKRLMHWKMSPLKTLPSVQFPIISSEYLVEEETLPFYKKEHYFPVHIGEILNPKYQVIGKLGFGSYSTVWLCRDLW